MEILLKDTNQIVTDIEFRNMYPNASFPALLTPDVLDDFNAVSIMEGPQAEPTNPYQYSMRNGVQEINGKWFTKYILGPIFTDNEIQTAEEQELQYRALVDDQQAIQVRATRDLLLSACDWTVVVDAPTDKKAWKAYRQALRDITSQEGFPFNVVFPDKPV